MRDELQYNPKFRQALDVEVQEVRGVKNDRASFDQAKPSSVPQTDTSRVRYSKKEVLEKVNNIAMNNALDYAYNYNSYQGKQLLTQP